MARGQRMRKKLYKAASGAMSRGSKAGTPNLFNKVNNNYRVKGLRAAAAESNLGGRKKTSRQVTKAVKRMGRVGAK